jgi:drug/metabolite transporter (DMT)-like permease
MAGRNGRRGIANRRAVRLSGGQRRHTFASPTMWLLPLTLVLLSAGLHASWNLIVKRQDDKLFSGWLTSLVPSLLLAPALVFTGLPPLDVWPILCASGLVHTVYMISLVQAYSHGDLSVVYPVARGSAPLLVAIGAPLLLGERLSPTAVFGIVLVGGGITCLGLSARRSAGRLRGLLWALATAGTIATYSMIDKVGVARAHPLAYVIVLLGLNGLGMTPYVLWKRDRRHLWALWRETWPSAVTGGLLSLVAYLLVLTAMRLTQVSYVAALRETSVVFAAVLGARVLGEPYGGRRVVASIVVACGLFLLVLAMRG